MKLSELAKTGVVVLAADDTLNAAIQQMWKLNIRHLPVVRRGVPVGMVSERDILHHICWDEHQSENHDDKPALLTGASRVDQIMTRPVITLSPGDPIEKAVRVMLNKGISAVPIAAGDQVVGIVTETDFLRGYFDEHSGIVDGEFRDSSVADHMTANVFTIEPTDPTLSAIWLMREHHVRHLPVVKKGTLLGIISDLDILRGSSRDDHPVAISVKDLRCEDHTKVAGIMSTHVETLDSKATLGEVAMKLVANKIGAIPIVDGEQLVGIITETDLLRRIVDKEVAC